MRTKNIIFILFLFGIFLIAACQNEAVGRKIMPNEPTKTTIPNTQVIVPEVNCEKYYTKQNCLKYETCTWDGKRCARINPPVEITTTTTLPYKQVELKTGYINYYPSSNNELNGNTLCTMKGYTGCITQYVLGTYEHFGSTFGSCKDLKIL